ncbi:PleD family two-component system response regulator [Limoniibacter endophyticus]|uniref:diguanylate cyclase n=1 Tax=Limoniibacter endophyticus TaxID=1565040 RepID=A0A8J3GIB4_9HYPH|nr:PleD family two-component system response regulator [Limoniibacter endophyticus]GHC75965.1 PleD family two-component system response regulator [Limoniibacter endophyticus]
MTARILVVDDVPANVRLLEAMLSAEYFDVLTAASGPEALEICEAGRVDVILLDVMMPEMDGFEVCKRLKLDPRTAHVPVVMITALNQIDSRVKGLEAGADDFLSKPVNGLQLMTRVKSLVRLKTLTDELRLRASTTRMIGIEALMRPDADSGARQAQILVIDEHAASSERISSSLQNVCDVLVVPDPQSGLFQASQGDYDCIIISGRLETVDPLRLCSQLRSLDKTRSVPIVMVAEQGEDAKVVRALELGINDFMLRPIDPHELTARIKTQIRRKRYDDELRASLSQTLEMAVTDSLTGLNNRRYLDSHLRTLIARSMSRQKPLSLLICDLDHFKLINDSWGHDGGDAILREFAQRLRDNVRGIDLACRFGGEEFVVVMPDTPFDSSTKVAERIRADVERQPFTVGQNGQAIPVTVSIGVASLKWTGDTMEDLLKRADRALYQAKRSGRNRVAAEAA